LVAPVAVTVLTATGPLRGAPLLAGLLAALLFLAPAAVCVTAALSGIGQVAAQIAAAGNEAELAILRVLVDTLLFGYALALAPADCVAVGVAALVAAWAILLCIIRWPEAPLLRRHGALALDMALFSAYLHFGGAAVAGWYPIYLLAMIHAGLRLGLDALLVSAAAGVLGFAALVMSTEFWRLQPALAGGLLFALAAMPACLAGVLHALATARARASGAEAERQTALRLIADTLRNPPASRRTAMDPSSIEDVLDFAALEAGTFAPPVETFDLRSLIRHSLLPVLTKGAAQQIRLGWRVDPRLPDRLRGHAAALSRILGGLASQALATAPTGAVRVTITPETIEAQRIRLKLRIDGFGARSGSPADDGSALSLRLIERLVKMAEGRLAVERLAGGHARIVVTLPLAIEPGVSRRALDLGHRLVLLATEDDELARDLAEPLAVWNAQPSWPEDIDTALAGLAVPGAEPRPVLIVDGRDKLLSALSLAHRAGQAASAPFVVLIAMPAQIEGLGQVEEDGLDSFVPAPVSELLLANALDALPLEASRPEPAAVIGGRAVRAEPPPAAAAEIGDRITPIAAHPRFAPETPPAVDPKVIEGLRALGGGPDFLGELIETFHTDAQQVLQRLGQAASVGDAAGFGRAVAALRRSAGQLGGTQLCELLASLQGLTSSELRQRGAGHLQRVTAEIERFTAALLEFLPSSETRRR
jgi:signal transduction histidine kinase/HPt (histidine-containing phosphotransfer) domain-containing protein